jgi:hypothetical protein
MKEFIQKISKETKKINDLKIKFTLIEDESSENGMDILIFPDAIK